MDAKEAKQIARNIDMKYRNGIEIMPEDMIDALRLMASVESVPNNEEIDESGTIEDLWGRYFTLCTEASISDDLPSILLKANKYLYKIEEIDNVVEIKISENVQEIKNNCCDKINDNLVLLKKENLGECIKTLQYLNDVLKQEYKWSIPSNYIWTLSSMIEAIRMIYLA